MQKKEKYKIIKLIISICILFCTISFILIFGRYVTNSINNFFIRTKDFYFNSDKLSEGNSSIYQIDNWSGVDDYVITINMNSRKNNIKAVDYDIEYDISYTCSDNAICQLSKTEGIIYANTNSDYFNLTITPNGQLKIGDKVVVEIEAKSKKKYIKTIRGKFTLVVGKEMISYQITDSQQSPYMELRITNTLSYYNVNESFGEYGVGDKIDSDTYLNLSDNEKSKCYSALVTIEFDPKEILFDITNELYKEASNIETTVIDGMTYVKAITFSIDVSSSRDIRFYKVDVSKNYTYPDGNGTSSVVKVTSK
jgi:hypothetical protein